MTLLLKIEICHNSRSVKTETKGMPNKIEYVQKGHRRNGKEKYLGVGQERKR
jgi:hypothetical protein